MHADGLVLANRQMALEKKLSEISDRQSSLENLIKEMSKTMINDFTDLRKELRLTSYMRTSPATFSSATTAIEIPPIPTTVARPSSLDAPVITANPIL